MDRRGQVVTTRQPFSSSPSLHFVVSIGMHDSHSSKPPHSPFLKGGSNFHYLPQRRGSEKLNKGGRGMVQGHVFLKRGRKKLVLFLFNIFRVYQLEIPEITLKSHHHLQDAFWMKLMKTLVVHPAADDDFVKSLYSLQNCPPP